MNSLFINVEIGRMLCGRVELRELKSEENIVLSMRFHHCFLL